MIVSLLIAAVALAEPRVDRLELRHDPPRTGTAGSEAAWTVVDAHGRSLRAWEFAERVGQPERARALRGRWVEGLVAATALYTVGSLAVVGGLGVGAHELLVADRFPAAGLALLAGGTVVRVSARLPARRALKRRWVRHHYDRAEAQALIEQHNAAP